MALSAAKTVLGLIVAVALAALAGWLSGSYRQAGLNRALETSQLRNELLAARNSVLSARLEIYAVNFGNASKQLEEARASTRRAEARLKMLRRDDDVKRVQVALVRIDEAQQLALRLDQAANTRAADAATILAGALDGASK